MFSPPILDKRKTSVNFSFAAAPTTSAEVAAMPRPAVNTASDLVAPTPIRSLFPEKWSVVSTTVPSEVDNKNLYQLGRLVNEWELEPSGTEGYRTAEVTLGGVDTKELSSKTMETKAVAGLYFIGEVVDVTGHLGGYNFQWAWSSGFVAGQHV